MVSFVRVIVRLSTLISRPCGSDHLVPVIPAMQGVTLHSSGKT